MGIYSNDHNHNRDRVLSSSHGFRSSTTGALTFKAQWHRLVRPGQLRWRLPGGRRSGRGRRHGERHRADDDHAGGYRDGLMVGDF